MSYLRLPEKAKPADVLSKDRTRPVLCCAHLRQVDEGWQLHGTDSYRAAIVALELVSDDYPEDLAAMRGGPMTRETVDAITKAGAFRPETHRVRILDRKGRATGQSFDWDDVGERKLPDINQLIPEDNAELVIGINAEYLLGVQRAMGAESVVLHIRGPLRAIEVRPAQKTTDSRGVVMPVRIV